MSEIEDPRMRIAREAVMEFRRTGQPVPVPSKPEDVAALEGWRMQERARIIAARLDTLAIGLRGIMFQVHQEHPRPSESWEECRVPECELAAALLRHTYEGLPRV
jgi:hypothetical protein